MPFTTPRTWVTDELVDANKMNTHVRDNLIALWPYVTLGDMSYAASGSVLNRLPIGTQNQTLTVKNGIPAWSNHIACKVNRNSPVSVPSNVETELGNYETKPFDTAGFYTSGSRIVIPANHGGLYLITVRGYWDAQDTAGTLREIALKANLVTLARASVPNTTISISVSNNSIWQELTSVHYCNPGDQIYATALQKSSVTLNFRETQFSVTMLR